MNEGKRVRVLIVDDSATARVALRGALRHDPEIEVVGEAAHGTAALEMVKERAPDLVTMDLYLKGQNGLDITSEIMYAAPTPIVVVTAVDPQEPSLVYEALRVGVLEVLGKLPAPNDPSYERKRGELARVVKSLSRVPVVRRRRPWSSCEMGRRSFLDDASSSCLPEEPATLRAPRDAGSGRIPSKDWTPRVVLLGASTGGPPILCELLRAMPRANAVPVVMVQHMAAGFTNSFATWLEAEVGRRTTVVNQRTKLERGCIYLGGEGSHLQVVSPSHVAPVSGSEVNFHRPSVDVLFLSAARHFGAEALAFLLTGMGGDGAEGMRALFDAGARTIAQSPSSCVVDGMPRRAITLGGVCSVLDPEELSLELSRLGAGAQ